MMEATTEILESSSKSLFKFIFGADFASPTNYKSHENRKRLVTCVYFEGSFGRRYTHLVRSRNVYFCSSPLALTEHLWVDWAS